MANVYDKLKEMNLTLPTPPAKGGLYTRLWEAQAQYYRDGPEGASPPAKPDF